MKPSFLVLRRVTALSALFALCSAALAQNIIWINSAPNTTTNWSDPLNWLGSVPPGVSNVAFFANNAGAATAPGIGNVDNFVDQNALVLGLTFSETNGFHNTLIKPGVTLTISNDAAGNLLLSGTETDAGATGNLYNTISGAGGILLCTSTNINSVLNVRQGSAGTTTPMSTLDLSGLDNFNLNVGQVRVSVYNGAVDHPGGTLILAKTNLIQAHYNTVTTTSGSSGSIEIYDCSNNNGNARNGLGVLQLGIRNSIYADAITVGRSKCPAGTTMIFNPNFVVNNPTAFIRGYNSNRVNYFSVADGSGVSSTAIHTASVDFTGGTVDAMIDQLFVGKGINGANSGPPLGTLTMGSGMLDINTVELGYQVNAGATGIAKGTLNINGGTLVVNSNLDLGRLLGAVTTRAQGILNVMDGKVTAASVTHGGGTSSISLVSSTLSVTNAGGSVGTASAPIGSIMVGDSTLNLAVSSPGAAAITANSLTTASVTSSNIINIISISQVAGLSTLPIALIQAATPIAGNGASDFVLGTLPAGFAGHLQVNSSGTTIQLVLTASPYVANNWTGADLSGHQNTNWSDGLNWSTGVAPTASNPPFFNTTGAVGASALSTPGGGPGAIIPANINNIVDSTVTIPELIYGNTNGTYHNTFIAINAALNITLAGLTVGNPQVDFGDTTSHVTVTGGAGTLNVSNNTSQIYVGLGHANAASSAQAVLDISGLATFSASVANFLVGVGGYSSGITTVLQPVGTVYLAQTNTIRASSAVNGGNDVTLVALDVGDAGDAESAAGYGNNIGSSLYLGQTNAIFADYITTGRQWASGGIFFNPAVVSGNPTVFIRGASANPVNVWNTADGVQNASAGGSGTNDFTGGTVNALVNTLQIGIASATSTSTSLAESGTLTFNAGTITATTVNVSYNPAFTDGTCYNYGVGTLNVNGTGTLIVNSNLNLAAVTGLANGGGVVGAPIGTLNINGASVRANNIIMPSSDVGATVPGAIGSATSIVNMNGGSLIVSNGGLGAATAPLTSLHLTNATLTVGSTAAQLIWAENVSVSSTNTINMLSVQPLESYPATITILKSATAIVGGVTNFQVSFPAVGPGTNAYAGNLAFSPDGTALRVTFTSGPIGVRGRVTWNGPDAANGNSINWSHGNNWLLPPVPAPFDTAVFDNVGQSSDATTPGNIVDTNMTVASLWYGATNPPAARYYHNTIINPGVTLSVASTNVAIILDTGTQADPIGHNTSSYATIGGAAGRLVVNNPNPASIVIVSEGSSTFTGAGNFAFLDMSGLDTFQGTVGRLLLGVQGVTPAPAGTVPLQNSSRQTGKLYLAATNVIHLTQLGNIQPVTSGQTRAAAAGAALVMNDTGFGDDQCVLYLGHSNAVFADTITIGMAGCNRTALFMFNPNFSENSLYLRGANSGRVLQFMVGDNTTGDQTGNANPTGGITVPPGFNIATPGAVGKVDLSTGTSDLMIDNLYVGKGRNIAGGGYAAGILTLGPGTLNVNNAYLGAKSAAAGSVLTEGTLNLVDPSSVVVVNNQLYLGQRAPGDVGLSTIAYGFLTVAGGATLSAGTILTSGNGNISVHGGTVSVTSPGGSIGTANEPMNSIDLGDSKLNLAFGGPGAAVVTTQLTTSSTTNNTINLTQMPLLSGVPTTVTLIQSLAPISGTFDFVLGALPIGYSAHLQESADQMAVQLVITAAPPFSSTGTKITAISFQSATASLVMNGSNGSPNSVFYVLTSTNAAIPRANWTIMGVSSFDSNGNFSISLPYSATESKRFYMIESQ